MINALTKREQQLRWRLCEIRAGVAGDVDMRAVWRLALDQMEANRRTAEDLNRKTVWGPES